MSAQSIMTWALGTGLSLTFLVGFILCIRRPVAQWFGARAAYALWALPVLRLFLPTIYMPISSPEFPGLTPAVTYRGVDFVPLVTEAAGGSAAQTSASFIALIIWVIGSVVWLLWNLLKHWSYSRRVLAASVEADDPSCQNAMHQLRLGRMPIIRVAQDDSGPMVMGLFRPAIILPVSFKTGFTPEQQRLTLLHEMAHIKRRDLWAAFAALLFRAVNWPNPLIHYAAKAFRADQEAACDASVLDVSNVRSTDYAQTLIQAARLAAKPRCPAPLGLTIYHPLKERLMMIKSPKRRASFLSRSAALAAVFAAFTILAPVTLANQHDDLELAGKAKTTGTSKQIIKSIEDIDGMKVKKHYEIITKNGVTKAYAIDPSGRKTVIDPASIKTKHPMPPMVPNSLGHQDVEIIVMDEEGRELTNRRMKIIRGGDVSEIESFAGQGANVLVKTFEGDVQSSTVDIYSYSAAEDVQIHMGQDGHMIGSGQQAKAMVGAASGLLQDVETDALSSKARRKIEKARKALKEAQQAIADDT